jgi:hypothetical protein
MIKPKPIIIQSQVTNNSKRITIIVSGGKIDDIVKEKCSEIDVFIHDYDTEGTEEDKLQIDQYGKKYKQITF